MGIGGPSPHISFSTLLFPAPLPPKSATDEIRTASLLRLNTFSRAVTEVWAEKTVSKEMVSAENSSLKSGDKEKSSSGLQETASHTKPSSTKGNILRCLFIFLI
jgi:hypothetical protein